MKQPKKTKPAPPKTDDVEDFGDDSYLHVRRIRNPLFVAPPPIVENVFFSRVGHTFGPVPDPFGGPSRFIVQDFLLDQTGASGADGKQRALKRFDLTTTRSYRFNVYPKNRSKRVKVVPPTSRVFMGFDVGRRFVNAVSDYSDIYPAFSFFHNLLDTAPVYTYNYFFIGHNTNHWLQFEVNADVVSPFSFVGFTTIGTYPPRGFDPGIKSYKPYSVGLPFNLPGPNAVPYLVFSYITDSSVDPGPFVFIS